MQLVSISEVFVVMLFMLFQLVEILFYQWIFNDYVDINMLGCFFVVYFKVVKFIVRLDY